MAIDVNDIFEFVNYELTKAQSGNTMNKDEFNRSLKWANLEYFKMNFSLPESWQVGQPVSAISYENTQLITDRMKAFKQFKGGRNLPSLSIDADGQALYPSDYVHYSSIRYQNNVVVPVRDDALGDALTDSITPPTAKYPIVVFYNDYMQFYPTNLGFVDFTYLRVPVTPYWDATIVNDAYVYKANTSIQLEWDDTCKTDICNLIIGYVARNLKDQLNLVGSENRKDSGV